MEEEERTCKNCLNYTNGECNGNPTNNYKPCDYYADGRKVILKDHTEATKKEADFLAGMP